MKARVARRDASVWGRVKRIRVLAIRILAAEAIRVIRILRGDFGGEGIPRNSGIASYLHAYTDGVDSDGWGDVPLKTHPFVRRLTW